MTIVLLLNIACDDFGRSWAGTTSADSSDSKKTIDRLVAIWDGQKSDFVNARIQFLWCDTGHDLRPLPEERVMQMFSTIDLVSSPGSFNEIVPQLFRGSYPSDAVWLEPRTLIVEGRRYVEDGLSVRRVSDGENEITVDKRNNQIDVFPLGGAYQHHTHVGELRYIPDIDSSGISLADAGNDSVRLATSSGRVEWVVDTASGFVRQMRVRDGSGRTVRLRLQMAPILYPGDVLFPTAVVETRFSDGRLSNLQVLIVEDAEFDVSLDPSTFVVSADQGVVVVDQRASGAPRARRFRGELESVVDATTLRGEVPRNGEREIGGSGIGGWLVIGNLLTLLCIAFWIAIRHRATG